jgi:ElaB/YqjD/DUF883 family membrane-anchored ribosome-binding protein
MRIAPHILTMNVAERIESPRASALRRVPDTAGMTELEGPAARVADLARAVARRIRERPIKSLAVAIGVGFVVGGALSIRAGRMALAAAARHVAREVLKQVL